MQKTEKASWSKSKKVWKFFNGTFLTILWVAVLLLAAGMFFGYQKVKSLQLSTKELPVLTHPERTNLPGPVKVFSADGKLLGSTQPQKRIIVNSRMINSNVKKATVAIEDQRFYEHGGIDFQSAARALWIDLRRKGYSQGASTLTMQYVRNVYLNQQKTAERKLKEIALSLQLESIWSKDRILTAYLNTVYYGNGTYGIQAAAKEYFDKDAKDLSLAQAALLVGVPNDPATYDPRIHFDKAWQRARLILDEMFHQNMIDKATWQKAKKHKPKIARPKQGPRIFDPQLYQAAIEEAKKELPKHVYSRGGFNINLSISQRGQHRAQRILKSVYKGVGQKPIIAATFVDPATGRIKLMTASKQKGYFDFARQSIRQPGSTVKLFTTLTYLQKGGQLIDRIDNSPLKVKDGNRNYTIQPTSDVSDVSGALRFSQNPAFWRLFQKAGPKSVLKNEKALGLAGMDANSAASLGGVKYGVTTMQMAGAAGGLANNGSFYKPHVVVNIVNPQTGQTLFSDQESIFPKKAVEPEYAKRVNQAAMGVVNQGLPQLKQSVSLAKNRQVAGKTGTTEDNADAWFVGYSPNLSGAVWTGYEKGRRSLRNVGGVQGEVFGATIPAKTWNNIAKGLYSNLSKKNFAKPTGTVEIPSVRGKSQVQAVAILNRYRLSNIELRPVFRPLAKAETVLRVSPKVGSFVSPQTKINVYYQRSERPAPNFVGKNYLSVYRQLGDYIELKPKLVDSDRPTGTILAQYPLAGQPIKAGEELQITLATKRAPAKIITKKVEYVPTKSELAQLRRRIQRTQDRNEWIENTRVVPDLEGLSTVDASQILDSLDLKILFNRSGTITGQTPRSGERVVVGRSIRVYTTLGD